MFVADDTSQSLVSPLAYVQGALQTEHTRQLASLCLSILSTAYSPAP
jgi:hypothetical protein